MASSTEFDAGSTGSIRPERIGVLLVHGVGEQLRFEHLEAEARHIALAIKATPGVKSLNIVPSVSLDGPRHASELTYLADRRPSLQFFVAFDNGPQQIIEFREVWWADIDERNNLGSKLRFWRWALLQWLTPMIADNPRKLTDYQKMRRPTSPVRDPVKGKWIELWVRLQLFGVATVFFLLLTTWTLIRYLGQRLLLGKIPSPGILSSYIGDVKLYLQPQAETDRNLADLHQPPRVSIRRRVIRGLIEMALGDYDRWYILAHSLGTVVAQNGLNETELALPNYLDLDTWQRCENQGLSKKSTDSASEKKMMPPRPPWLGESDSISRSILFSKFRGLLTYGSPLDKFAALWPDVVMINNDPAFQHSTEWINVYDPTDAIAGSLDGYENPPPPSGSPHAYLTPVNQSFKASPILLHSHTCYFRFDSNDPNTLAGKVAVWLLGASGISVFPKPTELESSWQMDAGDRMARRASRYIQWWLLGIMLVAVWGIALRLLIGG